MTTIGAAAEKGSAPERKRLVDELSGRATADEQYFLVRLLFGELRQGALPGVMADAVAKAAGVPVADVRRARLFTRTLDDITSRLPEVVCELRALDGVRYALAMQGRPGTTGWRHVFIVENKRTVHRAGALPE